ncbi:Hint domain-containing protein [Acetobacteraceae bacterium KSS8]|uniref:Hint domain-containing protein n=1 Tax=Endosaccharibacter trunci TaxID=2812733 RepID=A0ABT1WAZ8_9PROT|nr:Hint domain-containing protein [Acetobacteraceae bacterium KSS8]
MAAALVSINAGVATIYSSGDLSALVGVSGLSQIIIARTANTPAGDPVIVNLSNSIAGVSLASSISILNGATALVGAGILNAGVATTLTVNGGIADLQGSTLGASALNRIDVGPQGGEIKVEPTGLSVGLLSVPVRFVDANGALTTAVPQNFVMDFPQSTDIPASYNISTNTTTIGDGVSVLGILGSGRTITLSGDVFNLRTTGTAHGFPTTVSYSTDFKQSDGSGGIITCFLAGSLIRTPTGQVAVEDLRTGDEIVAFVDGRETVRSLRWAGHARSTVQPGLPNDEGGYPVRIRAGALADGVPFKDMLVTPEHCLLLKGRFVPARMLVNGRSVFYDTSFTSFEYFHIETEPHSIIMADGVLTESYLDTGNRGSFRQSGTVISFQPSRGLSWDDAAAPLDVSRAFVEPLFRAIETRADWAELPPAPRAALLQDAHLRLVTDSGVVLRQAREQGGRMTFMIPAGIETVRIVSNSSRPCDVIGPFLDDRRELGVAVGAVSVFEGNHERRLTIHMESETLPGWHAREGAFRWTSGDALLPLGERMPNGIALLTIEIKAAGPYFVTGSVEEARVRRA